MNSMKLRFYSIVLITVVVCMSVSCKKMDSTYEDFVVKGGRQYPGAPVSLKFHGGLNRAKISFLRGSDANAVKARIFWNNFSDSVEVDMKGKNTVEYTFADLPEAFYSYSVRTYDAMGNSSIILEVSGNVYGDKYKSTMLARPLNSVLLNKDNELNLSWASADTTGGAYATEVEYVNVQGSLVTRRFPTKEQVSKIYDFGRTSSTIKYRTVYLPDSLSIDTFYTAAQTAPYFIDKRDWSVVAFDSEHPGDENRVVNIIDGDPGTRWHGQVGAGNYPHFFTVDMGTNRTIKRLSLWRMKGDDRAPDKIQISTSEDKLTWVDQGTFSFDRFNDAEQIFDMRLLSPSRYFRVTGLQGPQQYIVLGEVSVSEY